MQLPIKIDAKEKASLQAQIFEQIQKMILDGRLRGGDFLPTTRALSEQMGVSRNTTLLAYEKLAAEGYIETRPYVGTYVSRDLPPIKRDFKSSDPIGFVGVLQPCTETCREPEPHLDNLRAHRIVNPHASKLVADFWIGRPARDAFPLKSWSNIVWKRLRNAGDEFTDYKNPAGLPELRQAIADHLGPARGIIVRPEQVIVVGGAQDGLNLVSRLLIGPGSVVAVESPCYQGAAFLFESFGADLCPIGVDDSGMVIDRLPDHPGAIAYVTPSHQYPLGATLPLDRRIALISWAERNHGYILEDDYDCDFRFDGSPLTSIFGLLKSERVFYLGTFSKSMGPGLRLGYVVVPLPFVRAATALKTLMSNGQPWLEQAAMADYMADGGFARHLRRLRQVYLTRRNATIDGLRRHFGPVEIAGEAAGMHLVWKLPNQFPDAAEIERRALEVGVGVYTPNSGAAVDFEDTGINRRCLVLGYTSLSESEIELGIARLAHALAGQDLGTSSSIKSVFQRALA